jgi:hypothetical protein
MRNTLRTLSLFLALALMPAPAFAWGFVGHRLIMSRAIDLLPPELKAFFVANRDEIVFRVIDPDLWRNIGWPEDPNHFLDFGVPEYGKYPFTELPREYGAALEKFGKATLDRNGVVPWRLAETFGNLRRAFDGFRRQSPSSVSDAILFSAVMSHYIQDAHQPFHATINYDGVQTGQRGIHSRFERDLIERFRSRLTMTPAAPKPITNPRDTAFEVLLSGHQLVDAVLKADKDASAGKETYDDEYFEKFFVSVRPILERRLSEAITATAGLIIGAWEQAGRPAVRLQDARPVEKVEKVSR